MESNKVDVKIYGQEYVIAGEKSREHIMKVAAYIDTKMHEIERSLRGGTVTSIAVLSAVNAADDYFTIAEELEMLKKMNAELEKDVQHYVEMWEESKRGFIQYKEDAEKLKEIENSFFDLQMENVQLKSELERYKKVTG